MLGGVLRGKGTAERPRLATHREGKLPLAGKLNAELVR